MDENREALEYHSTPPPGKLEKRPAAAKKNGDRR